MKKPLLNTAEQEAFEAFCQQEHPPEFFPKPASLATTAPSIPEDHLTGRIVEAKVLTGSEAERPVYLVTVELSSAVSFLPGDAFGIFAPNEQFPSETLKYADLSSFPKKALLMSLSTYCHTEDSRTLLQFLASKNPAASAAYNRLRDEEFLSFKVLKAALGEDLQVPEEELVRLVGCLQPRWYSACRAQSVMSSTNIFQFCFNVSRRYNRDGSCIWEGHTASWLERLIHSKDTTTFPVVQRTVKNFTLPSPLNPAQPIVMIAAGTGVAPFIGFLDQLGSTVKPFSWLIFGFRAKETDFLFQHEIESPTSLSKLSLAQSRPLNGSKEYVQDVIRREAELFLKLFLQEEAIIYICGDELSMIKGVNEAIVEVLLKNGTVANEKEAQQLLVKLGTQGRIIRDIWV